MFFDVCYINNLKGKSLVPGFIDAHLHLTIYGTNLLGVSCVDPHIESLNDIYDGIRKEVEIKQSGEWIRAWGFNEHDIKEKRFPTKEELDTISTVHPIVIIRTCNHTSIANSKALEIAGFTKQSINPEGGIVEKNSLGELTGKLIENAHMHLFTVASFSDIELEEAMRLASDTFVKAGITSVHDAGGYGPGMDILRIMKQSINSGDIKVRVYAMIGSLTDSRTFIREAIDAGFASQDLQERMKQLEVIIVPNPGFMYVNGDSYIEYYGDRVEIMYPARDYIDLSIPAAVNRKTRNGQVVGARQSINVLEAVKAYTWMGAYASFEEQIKGSIEVGKLADFVVLNESLLTVEKEKIKNIKIDMTMIDGEILFEKVASHLM